MKRNAIIGLLVCALLVAALAGCGGTATKVDENTVQLEQSAPANEAEAGSEADAAADGSETPEEAEPVTHDILEELGFTITPLGDMIMPLAIYGTNDTQDMNVVTSIETTLSEEEGYSDTTFVFTITTTPEAFSCGWNAYDRNTGYELSVTTKTYHADGGSNQEDACIIDIDGTEYDCYYSDTWEALDADHYQGTVTIHHPNAYDGNDIVFRLGKYTAAMRDLQASAEDTGTPSRLGDTPELLEGMFYFTELGV